MKKPYNFLTIVLIAASGYLFTGCEKQLKEEVYSEILDDLFTPTESDALPLVAPVYSIMRPMMAGWQGYFDVQEESADAIITPARPRGWYDGGTYQRMHRHLWTNVESQPVQLWNRCYNGISSANRVIAQLEAGEIPVPATTTKENIIAELRAARAFFYYILMDNHGNVPIVTDPSARELPQQNTRAQVYDFVVKELNEILPQLSAKSDRSTYGRFNKWAVKALLAKVYLNAGVYTGTPQWEKCIAECDDIRTEAGKGTFLLEPNYRDVFKTNNENSKELIFTVPYDEIFATESVIHMKTLDASMQEVFQMQAQPWGGNCAVPQFINTYDADDSRLKDSWLQGPQYSPTGRLVISFVNTVTSIEKSDANHGFRIGKYEIKQGIKNGASNDFPIFRYADVLMMKAESLLRTGKADEAAALVTEVRARNFKATPAKAVVTGADLLKGSNYNYGYWDNGQITEPQGGADIQYGRFLDELGWEFAAEAHRRQDIIRFGVFTTKMWFQHRSSNQDKTIFPIPLVEMNKNPNLKQNKGYN